MIRQKNVGMKIICTIMTFAISLTILITGCTPASNEKIQSWTLATHVVGESLKSPSTASFPSYNDEYVTKNDDGTYSVSAYVDAENSFGAKIRSNWSCKVSGDNVTDVVIDN